MTALALLVPLAFGLGLLSLLLFVWTLRSGQYEDPDGTATRILFDEPTQTRK